MEVVYLGYWGGKYVYQPEYKPVEGFGTPPQVYKCACCKVRWFRSITNWYEGLCYCCWVEQFEGEDDL